MAEPFPLLRPVTSATPDTIAEEQHAETHDDAIQPIVLLPAVRDGSQPDGIEQQPKQKNRRRLFRRGLSHMSSSPSLAQMGRTRSSSSPYNNRTGASLSCVSLASSPYPPPAFHFSSNSNSNAATHANGSPGSSGASSPAACNNQQMDFMTRKIDLSKPDQKSQVMVTSVPVPSDVRLAVATTTPPRPKKSFLEIWRNMPLEVRIRILSFLGHRDLVRLSGTNRELHRICFDGQLWQCLDATDFYRSIPISSLTNIIAKAGPYVRDLNLRGCIQFYHDTGVMSTACTNLRRANLEGSLFSAANLHRLVESNPHLTDLNLTGLASVDETTLQTIATACPKLETLNVSWCRNVWAGHLVPVIRQCTHLKELVARELRGFDDVEVATALFETNRIEHLVLNDCGDLTDKAFRTMLHGKDPEMDLLTDLPLVPPRRLRYLDIGRCGRLSDNGVSALAHCVPDLEGLVASENGGLTDAAFQGIFASTPQLSLVDLEDLRLLTDDVLSNHLAKGPCAKTLSQLSISYCERLSDIGMLPLLRACRNLRSLDMDNTRISDLVMAEAVSLVQSRADRTRNRRVRPRIGLTLTVYDCPNVSWTGVREVLSRNAEMKSVVTSTSVSTTFPTEIIALKCFYGWQMTVDEHTHRVLRADLASANRLERKWADYMQANEEAGLVGAGTRRRRRRAREARLVHTNETGAAAGGAGAGGGATGPPVGIGRRRARTTGCAVM